MAKETKKPKKLKEQTLPFIYKEDKTLSPYDYSQKAGVSIAYVKSFLKKHDQEKQLFTKEKQTKNFVPAGSGLRIPLPSRRNVHA
jgi:hypothetical protein